VQFSKLRSSVSSLILKDYSKLNAENSNTYIEITFTSNSSCEKYNKKFNPEIDSTASNFVKALSIATVERIDSGISVLTLPDNVEFPINGFGSNLLFIRNYYPNLLATIRKFEWVCLIGNPGIQKSMFHWYYLAMIYNNKLGGLPPDYLNNSQPPKVILRQEGENDMFVFFVEEMIVHKINLLFSKQIFDYFDPKSTIYFYEPGEIKKEPYFIGLKLPIFISVSPDISRYKEFTKNGGFKLYMPCLESDELKTIGKFLREQPDFPKSMIDLYTDENITSRFEEYGGIYRHVLPTSEDYLNTIALEKSTTLKGLKDENIRKLLQGITVADPDVSHYIAQYNVEKTGNNAFKKFEMKLRNDDIRKKLQAYFDKSTSEDLKFHLIRADETGYEEIAARYIYEKLILRLHSSATEGINCRIRNNGENNHWKLNSTYNIYPGQLKLLYGKVPFFNDMKEGFLYYSLNTNFPICEMLYKQKDANGDFELCVIQVSRERAKSRKVKSFDDFKKNLDVTDFSKVRYFYFGHPSNVNDFVIDTVGHIFKSIQIAEVSPYYDFNYEF
jgi:hypothetical protein